MNNLSTESVSFDLAGARVTLDAKTICELWMAKMRGVSAPSSLIMPPVIGDFWAGQGGRYGGVSVTDDGRPCHLILAEVDDAGELNWEAAGKWAAAVRADGHEDFTLPNRHDGLTLFANLKDRFGGLTHWLSTVYASGSGYAWSQDFDGGFQLYCRKDVKLRARAVRRLIIQ